MLSADRRFSVSAFVVTGRFWDWHDKCPHGNTGTFIIRKHPEVNNKNKN